MEKGYKVIEENGRIKYQCLKCSVIGTCEDTIRQQFCHHKTRARSSEDLAETKVKKKEQKYKVKGMGISIKKFDSYFE